LCLKCAARYPVIDEIPVLLQGGLAEASHEHEEHQHKGRQAEYFDRHLVDEFEICRPHATPRLYSYFLLEKFRRTVRRIGSGLPGATALVVCGGSGMDAEFLAAAGAQVISTDISLRAAQRARERARRYGFK